MPGPIRSLPPPNKKRRIQKDSEFIQNIQRLEEQLTRAISENGSLNALADLLQVAISVAGPEETSKAIYALYRVFVLIINEDKLTLGGDEAAKVVKAWLWERLNTYVDFLGGLLKDEEKTLRISALQILFSLQKHLSTSYSKTFGPHPQFHNSNFRKIVSYLLLCPPSSRRQENSPYDSTIDSDVLDHFYDTWFSVYDDVRWFFLRDAGTLLSSDSNHKAHSRVAENLLSVLERLTTFPTEEAELNAWWVSELGTKPPKPKGTDKNGTSYHAQSSDEDDEEAKAAQDDDDDDWRKFFEEDKTSSTDLQKPRTSGARLYKMTVHQSLHSLSSHRAVFTRTWLLLLPRLSLMEEKSSNKGLAIRALNVMHRGVLPHLTRAVLVMDWVGSAVDFGGTAGLLALNALFTLIKEYNLDYPSFYTRLYAYLDRDVLHLKHRARFFRMTELFLSSTHLPSHLLASFIKRLSRLSLNAPPAAIVMIVPFTYNILKRHPALMTMIHRTDVDDFSSDPFLPSEPNPLNTQAQLSSLWELLSHRSHYHSGVSTLVKIFSEPFTKPSYPMEDFLDHAYGTLFETEANRKIKKEPALAIETGKKSELFPMASSTSTEEDESMSGHRDVVNELWTFA